VVGEDGIQYRAESKAKMKIHGKASTYNRGCRCAPCREAGTEKLRRWRAANPEKVKAALKRYRESHLEMNRQCAARHRARKMGNGWEPYDRWDIWDRDSGTCQLCLEPIFGDFHIDHVVPVSEGGPDAPWNVVVAHPACNRAKGTMDMLDWLELVAERNAPLAP
jgi:5-methylcytosine-specific restriction endonuclease McrA